MGTLCNSTQTFLKSSFASEIEDFDQSSRRALLLVLGSATLVEDWFRQSPNYRGPSVALPKGGLVP